MIFDDHAPRAAGVDLLQAVQHTIKESSFMKTQRVAILLTAASVALVAAGCGGDGSDIIEGDTSFSGVGGQGGQGGSGPAGGGTGGNNGGNSGGQNPSNPGTSDSPEIDPTSGLASSGVRPTTYGQGGGYLQAGFLYNQSLNPLRAEIDSSFNESGIGVSDTPITPGTAGNCPEGTAETDATATLFEGTDPFPVCRITQASVGQPGSQVTEINLTNDFVYYLDDPVRIGNGFTDGIAANATQNVTMNIEGGVQIFANPNNSTANGGSYLRITRGATLNVMGTLETPVLMTAARLSGGEIVDPSDFSGIGQWGGLVIDGYAPVNAQGSNGQSISEAAPANQTNYFGGNDPDDSSGEIHYLVIGESGVPIRPDEEVQGLTLEGVGAGTEIDHVQVFGSRDDGIEWFGGTVNLRYVLINGAEDDSLDMDLGFQGTVKNAIAVQSTSRGNRTVEADNNGDGFGFQPKTSPNLANVLLLGAGDQQGGSAGMLLREGFGGDIENSVVTDLRNVGNRNGGAYSQGCFVNTDEVDRDLQAAGLAFFCRNDDSNRVPGTANVNPNLYPTWYNEMFQEEGTSGDNPGSFIGGEDTSLEVDPSSYVVTTSIEPQTMGTNNGFQADAYMGAVDPQTPAGQEWFKGWTVSVEGQ